MKRKSKMNKLVALGFVFYCAFAIGITSSINKRLNKKHY
tara:strand:- start:150 stop:266 length:117 start_codon:yes stop_codon:yes gene_type:complete